MLGDLEIPVSESSPLLDPRQLVRIEATHRGYLYQHLYAAACLLLAGRTRAQAIVVEHDEDVEIVHPDRRVYVQVKTRTTPLVFSDINGALQRFESLREEHRSGGRSGRASFVLISNIAPGANLLAKLNGAGWPKDVALRWPDGPSQEDAPFPHPWPDIGSAVAACTALAAALPFGLLAPETLVWKLAGCVTQASAGEPPRQDHTFQASELPGLFEQLIVQWQDFPAPPERYRPQVDEPALLSTTPVRIITGFSGAGKTAWVSQAAVHTVGAAAYVDVIDTPGPALASSLARELAARLFGRTGGGLGEILLPGASGLEILQLIGARLTAQGQEVTVVLDNAHCLPASDLRAVIQHTRGLKFTLLCQPGRNVQELEALLAISAEPLRGWAPDTIAQEAAAAGCRGDFAACQRLADLTGGLPLYIQNAMSVTAAQYDGSLRDFCADLEAQTNVVETAQEIILARVFEGLPLQTRAAVGVLSLSDIPLERGEVSALLAESLQLDERSVAVILRQLRPTGSIEIFGGDRIKIHSAIGLLGQAHLAAMGAEPERKAQVALKDLLSNALQRGWEMARLSLYLRMLAATGDIKPLVEFATDELFHEMGIGPEVMAFLEAAAIAKDTDPEDRFWALDGLAFSDTKQDKFQKASEWLDMMDQLIAEHDLGVTERLAVGMKRMNLLAMSGDHEGVLAAFLTVSELLPDRPGHLRIFRYNAARALLDLGRFEEASDEIGELIEEYYEVLGLTPKDITGRNARDIRPLLKEDHNLVDNLKHLADCLDMYGRIANAMGGTSPFARIHAMKFYELAQAPDSLIRVGQDLVDEFVGRNDFIGARQMIETNLLPNVLHLKLAARIIPVRSQYAVVLAMCGDFAAADAEMARLAPYEAGLDERGQWELRNQRKAIAKLRLTGPPPQLRLGRPPAAVRPTGPPRTKVGRNEPCPCGSGRKYKKCHG